MINNINTSYEKNKTTSKSKKSAPCQNKSKNKINRNDYDKQNYNIIVTKKNPFSNKISINNNGDFPSFSNNFTFLIKDHYHNNKLYISNIKLISESINEQILFSRSSINDILLYLNQIVKPRYNGAIANMNEKYIKDKLYQINFRMEKIIDLKNNLSQNIENNNASLDCFNEEINKLLTMMKNYLYKKHNDNHIKLEDDKKKDEEIKNMMNLNNYNEKNKNIKIDFIDVESIKDKYLEIYQKKRQKLSIDDSIDKNDDNIKNHHTKERNSFSSSGKTKIIKKKKLISIRPNSYSRTLTHSSINPKKEVQELNLRRNTIECCKDKSLNEFSGENIDIIKISNLVLDFLKEMNNVQEMILKKAKNIKKFKKNFEFSKNNLKKICEKTLQQDKNDNNKNNLIIQKLQKEKLEIEQQFEDKNKEYNILKKLMNEASKKNEELKNEIQDIKKEKIEKNNKIINLEKEIKELESTSLNYINESKNMEKNIKIIKEENEKLSNNFESLKKENILLKNDLKIKEEKNNNLSITIKDKKEEEKEIMNKMNLLEESIKNVNNENNKIKEENTKL